MKKKYRIIPIALTFIFLLHTQAFAAQAVNQRILLFLDGNEITNLPEPPFMYQDNILVPAREFFESAGANVTWHEESQQVLILYNGSLLSMTLGNKIAWLDGRDIEMSVPPMIKNGKTMIPLRFPAECFGFGVEWVGETQSAHLSSPAVPEAPAAETPPLTPGPAVSTEAPIIPDPAVPTETPMTSDPAAPTETPTATPPFTEIPPAQTVENPAAEYTSALDYAPAASSSGSPAKDISSGDIPSANYDQVTIKSLLTPKENGSASYIAAASGPISEVQKQLLPDNRLIIDITNSLCGLEGPFYTDASVPVTGVRASQFMNEPSITRIVFDLTGGAEYSVSLSADRTQLTVSFTKNIITGVSFESAGTSDSVTVTGTSRPMVQLLPAANPNRFILSINNATLSQTGAYDVTGKFAARIESVQTDEVSAKVEVTVNEWPSFEIIENGNSVTVRFFTNTVLGVTYDYAAKEIKLIKSPDAAFDINTVIHQDEYTRGLYTLTLPINGESVWGYGDILARDDYIETVKVGKNASGQTQLIVEEARVLAFTVSEDENYYIIKPRLPKEVYGNIVLIDPGHGGSEPGTSHNGILEKQFNLSVSSKLMELINADPNIKAYATRLDDSDFDLYARPYYANDLADLFVSIHANSYEENPNANGTEVYYYPHDNDAWLGFASKQFAEIMNERFKNMLDIGNRGVKSNIYVVLHYTTIPAILCEMGFVTNQGDAAKLSNEQYQWQMAYALYYGIQDAFGVYRPIR